MDMLTLFKMGIQVIKCFPFLLLQNILSVWKSIFQSKNIEVRKVTENDYEKVISIRDSMHIYRGKDYLPESYVDLISSPENEGFCAVINNKYVAFALLTVINDKTTIVIRSVRVNKHYSGQGIVRILIQSIIKHYLSIKNVKLCWISFTQSYFFERMQKGIFKFITIRKSAVFKGDVASIVSLPHRDYSAIEVLNAQTLTQIFKTENIIEGVFPSNCIVSHFVPFKPIQGNVPMILNISGVMLASDLCDSNKIIISIGNWNNGKKCASYRIELYGNIKDRENLINHLNMHIEHCKKTLTGPVEVRVSTDEYINLNSFNSFFRKINLRKDREKYLIIAERNLQAFR